MDIVIALTAITQAIGIAKTVSEIDKSFDQADHKLRMAEILSALAEAKIALGDAKVDLSSRDDEIRKRYSVIQRKEGLVQSGSYFYDKTESGSPTGTPYCPVCMQTKGLFFKIVMHWTQGQPLICPNCKSNYSSDPAVY